MTLLSTEGVLHKSTLVPENIQNPSELLRPAKMSDLSAVQKLVSAFVESQHLLPVSKATFEELLGSKKSCFFVMQDPTAPQSLIACGGLKLWSSNVAELRTLCVANKYQGQGYGGNLVSFLECWASLRRVETLFALTKTPDFFVASGYKIVSRTKHPKKIVTDCMVCHRFSNCGEVTLEKIL